MSEGWHHLGQPEHVGTSALQIAVARFDSEVGRAVARREHYWLALVGFVVHPPMQDDAVLDHENIRVAPVVGCYICEEPYREGIARRCKGEPS